MGNMSYCRFRNTLEDLRDCRDHIADGVQTEETTGEENAISTDEAKARSKLIKVCQEIVETAEEEDIS